MRDAQGTLWYRIGGADDDAGFAKASASATRTKRRADMRGVARGVGEMRKMARTMDEEVRATCHAAFGRAGWADNERCDRAFTSAAWPSRRIARRSRRAAQRSRKRMIDGFLKSPSIKHQIYSLN